MEFYQLEELAAFARYGTISKAAEMSGVSQPAMSRAMKLLEEDLGVAIFRRTSNTIELNETGQLACQWAERITRMADSAKEEIRAFDRRQRTILVGSVAPAPLWSVVSILSALETEKTVAGEMRQERILAEGLKNGTYRFVITADPPSFSGFSSVRLGEENLMFLLPESHRHAKRKSLSFSDMNGENMLLLEDIGQWRELPQRMMPDSKFIVQTDRESFEELVMRSEIPSFASDLVYRPVKGKVAVPVSDKEAHLVYFITARSSQLSVMNQLARQFRNAFNGRSVYAV